MSLLSPEERMLIAVSCLGVLCLTAAVMACRVIPLCLQAKRKEEEERLVGQRYSLSRSVISPRDSIRSVSTMSKRGSMSPSETGSESVFGKPGLYRIQDDPPPPYFSENGGVALGTHVPRSSRRSFLHPADNSADKRGRIEFALEFCGAESRIGIVVKKCTDLPTSPYGTLDDSFVKLLVIRDAKRRWLSPRKTPSIQELDCEAAPYSVSQFCTPVVRRSLNPVFNARFETNLTEKEARTSYLKFMTFSCDRYGHQTIAGEVDLPLRQTALEGTGDFALDLGEITQNLGQLFLSLTYLPTASRLCVNVLKATGLKFPIGAEQPSQLNGINPQLRLSLCYRGKTMEKHKSIQTTCTTSPVFNDTITFDLRAEELDKVVMMIQVVHNETPSPELSTDSEFGGTFSPVPSAMASPGLSRKLSASRRRSQYDRTHSITNLHAEPDQLKDESASSATGDNRVSGADAFRKPRPLYKSHSTSNVRNKAITIGRVAFGSQTGGLAQLHWTEMVKNPRKGFARWHKLIA